VVAVLIILWCSAPQGWLVPLAVGSRHPHIFAVPVIRARHRVSDVPVRGTRADPTDAGARPRRGRGGLVLGASGWQCSAGTLPNISGRCSIGVVCCAIARYGRVRRGAVVSALSGTDKPPEKKMPLHVRFLHDYQFRARLRSRPLLAGFLAGSPPPQSYVEFRPRSSTPEVRSAMSISVPTSPSRSSASRR